MEKPASERLLTADEFAAAYREFAGEGLALWHFPMMNDVVRNAAYEQALGRVVKNGGLVLDIGTGSGLLAMMAARQGASRVITCEAIPQIADQAREIIRVNGFADRIQVVNRLSTDLVVGRDLPERADALVTEIFDDGLLGEKAFEAISHARTHLLKPDAAIIPSSARVIAIPIESQEIYENHRVGSVSGFDLSAFNQLSTESYTGYHLEKMSHRPLAGAQAVFEPGEFEFSRYPGDKSVPFEFTAVCDGVLHAVAYWFELKLDSETVIKTGPGLPRLSCWKAAVQLLRAPRKVAKGERVKLVARHDIEAIWFTG